MMLGRDQQVAIIVGILVHHHDRVPAVCQDQARFQVTLLILGAKDAAGFLGAVVDIRHSPRRPKLLHQSSPSISGSYGFPSTRKRSSLPTLKNGTRLAATETNAPLFGLRPCRARRFLTTKLPKPRISIRSPPASASTIESKMALIITSESRRER